jgi:hypothetical protein
MSNYCRRRHRIMEVYWIGMEKKILSTRYWQLIAEFVLFRIETVASCWEEGNEHSGTIKYGEFLISWAIVSLSKKIQDTTPSTCQVFCCFVLLPHRLANGPFEKARDVILHWEWCLSQLIATCKMCQSSRRPRNACKFSLLVLAASLLCDD